MDAVGFFLLVFLVYTVVAVVAMMRVSQCSKELVALRQRVERMEHVQLVGAQVAHDVAQDVAASSEPSMEDLQRLMSNPLVQQFMPGDKQ